jgi:gas vesicle protein
MKRGKSLAFGILTGGLAACAAVLVSAPYSGKELRSRLHTVKKKSEQTLLDLKSRTHDVKEQVQHTTQTSNTIVKNVMEDLAQSVEQWKQSTLPHQQAIQSHLGNIQNSLTHLEQQVQNKNNKQE